MMVIFRHASLAGASLAPYPVGWAVIACFTRCRSRLDVSEFEQFKAESLDLREDAEQRGLILEQAGEHGLAALQLRPHRGKGGEGGSSEPAVYPDRVQARRCAHAPMLQADLVSRRRRILVIVWGARATSVMSRSARVRGAAAPVRVERRMSDRARRVWNRCCGYAC
jgi:hypothetical protein